MGNTRSLITALIASTLISCGSAQPARDTAPEAVPEVEPAPVEAEPAPAPMAGATGQCLPVVNGCGCAYACGRAMGEDGNGTFAVAHDYQDSTLATCTVERWCFDSTGHGSPEPGAATETNCMDVFYDRSPCGGECIPTTEFLTCHMEGDSCRG